jgi:hypothetical protein
VAKAMELIEVIDFDQTITVNGIKVRRRALGARHSRCCAAGAANGQRAPRAA